MMCLSDANEWFLHSSVSPPLLPFRFLSPSAFLICQKTLRKEFFFSPLVMKLPQGDSKEKKTRMTIFFLLEIRSIEVFKGPDSFLWPGSELAERNLQLVYFQLFGKLILSKVLPSNKIL